MPPCLSPAGGWILCSLKVAREISRKEVRKILLRSEQSRVSTAAYAYVTNYYKRYYPVPSQESLLQPDTLTLGSRPEDEPGNVKTVKEPPCPY